MKITDVKLRFAKHYLFVQVYTDAGIVGLGEAGNWGYLQATAAAIEKFADYLIGKDPFRIEDFNQNFLRSVYFRGSVIMSAISAIDIALWDIKGKMANMPVYDLFGGKMRAGVPVYRHVDGANVDEICENIEKYRSIGVKHIRCQCGGYGGGGFGPAPGWAAKGAEPGVYLDGKFGIRIEDTVCLAGGKVRRLFTDDKKLMISK